MPKKMGAIEIKIDELEKLLSSNLNCRIKRIEVSNDAFYIVTWYSSSKLLENNLSEVLNLNLKKYDITRLKESNIWGVSDKGYDFGVGFVYDLKLIKGLLEREYDIKILDTSNYIYNKKEKTITLIISN